MVVLVDYMLAPTKQTLLGSPQVADALKEGMLVGTADSPQFQSAPVYMKEAMTFPYRYGLDFEAALLKQSGKEKAFAGALQNPPHTTRQIMEPQTYLSGEQLPPMPLPDFAQDFKNYERFDMGAIGEFDVAALLDQYAGAEASRNLYPHWRGGYYYSVHPKGDLSAVLGLLYLSRWSSPAKAEEFAAIYARSLDKRYHHVHEVALEGQPPIGDLTNLATLHGAHTWLTEEGPVVIDSHEDSVLITESLDQPTTEKLERELLGSVAAALAN